jgi:hypothetical protein
MGSTNYNNLLINLLTKGYQPNPLEPITHHQVFWKALLNTLIHLVYTRSHDNITISIPGKP